MFIPIGTDRRLARRPLVTEGLILANLAVYLAGLMSEYFGWFSFERMVDAGHYDPAAFRIERLITYQFLHDPSDIGHVAFNMLFLWVFGGAVENRLKRGWFLLFYLVGGAIAGLVHGLVSNAPVIGASGAVAGVSGAFAALFPRSHVRVLIILFIIGVFSIPSVWLIGIYALIDAFRQGAGWLGGRGSQVAYSAHLAGYAYGFGLCITLLATGVLKREDCDVFFLFKQARRRSDMRKAKREVAGGVWVTQNDRKARAAGAPPTKPPEAIKDPARPNGANAVGANSDQPAGDASAEDDAGRAVRARVLALARSHDLEEAARIYAEFLPRSPNNVFPEPVQLDLANQLFSMGDHKHAAAAYELLLSSYPSTNHAQEVRLALAVLYTRHLSRADQAQSNLAAVSPGLKAPNLVALADQLKAELRALHGVRA